MTLPPLRPGKRTNLLCVKPCPEMGLRHMHEVPRDYLKRKFGSLEKFYEVIERHEELTAAYFDFWGKLVAATKPYREMLAKEPS